MRKILNLFSPPEAKASRAGRLLAIETGGRARWTPRDYAALAREGYLANAVVHRAVKLVAECPAFALVLLHALWSGHEVGINGFASLTSLLIAYFGARFGVLGVYVSGRSKEKQACATGQLAPSALEQLVKALVKKK
jgi:hypothetical protein